MSKVIKTAISALIMICILAVTGCKEQAGNTTPADNTATLMASDLDADNDLYSENNSKNDNEYISDTADSAESEGTAEEFENDALINQGTDNQGTDRLDNDLNGTEDINGTAQETKQETETETALPYNVVHTEDGLVELGIEDGELTYIDAHDNIHTAEVHEDWPMHDYDVTAFAMKEFTADTDLRMTYDSDKYDYRLGVDVFGEHGGIDWWAVEYVGYDFAIMRAGYRGYLYPSLVLDDRVMENIEGALKYGLDVGVYFFSQAISEREAEEEALFVIDALEEHGFGPDDLKMGIIFDPESIDDEKARTNNVSGEQFTRNAIAFCETVESHGYKPMIYSNMIWEDEKFDLGKLKDYPIWYADYHTYPQTPYDFEIWQYGHGMVAGCSAQVDVNIQLIPKE